MPPFRAKKNTKAKQKEKEVLLKDLPKDHIFRFIRSATFEEAIKGSENRDTFYYRFPCTPAKADRFLIVPVSGQGPIREVDDTHWVHPHRFTVEVAEAEMVPIEE